jgi:hypothetical protein
MNHLRNYKQLDKETTIQGPLDQTGQSHIIQYHQHDYRYAYPLYFQKAPAQSRLAVAHSRSNSITAHIHRQPNGGACFIWA